MAKNPTIKQLKKLQSIAQNNIKAWVKYEEDLNDYILAVENKTVPGGQPPPNPPGTH